MTQRAATFARSLALAQACADLGARARTIHLVSGIPLPDIQRLFFPDPRFAKLGRAPESPEWYHTINWTKRLQASIFGSIYMRLRRGGFPAEEALVGAYKSYLSVCNAPHSISFDRAFNLAGCVDDLSGRWSSSPATLCVLTCSSCSGEHLASIGQLTSGSNDCPFCKMMERHERNMRLGDIDGPSSITPRIDPIDSGEHAAALGVRLDADANSAPSHHDDGDTPLE